MTLLNDGIRYSSAISAAKSALVSRQAFYWQTPPVVRMVQSPPQDVPRQQRRTTPPQTPSQH